MNNLWLRTTIGLAISIGLGILFGLLEATLWLLHIFVNVRAVIPYAAADVLVIFGLTALITAILAAEWNENEGTFLGDGQTQNGCEPPCRRRNLWVLRFVKVIMIAAAIFLIFVQVFLGVDLTPAAKAILAFIGAISFWVSLTTFIGFIFAIARRA